MSPDWGHWGPLTPQKWLWCPYKLSQWPHPSWSSWCSLLPWWVLSLLLSVRDLGVPHGPSIVMGPSTSRLLLPRKPGGGVTCQAISSTFVGNVGSDFVLWTFNSSSALWHQAILSPELLLWGLCLEPQEIGGVCPAAMTGLEGCNTSFHPGNRFGDCSLLVHSSFGVWKVLDPSAGLTMGTTSSSVTFTAASSTGGSVYTG